MVLIYIVTQGVAN